MGEISALVTILSLRMLLRLDRMVTGLLVTGVLAMPLRTDLHAIHDCDWQQRSETSLGHHALLRFTHMSVIDRTV